MKTLFKATLFATATTMFCGQATAGNLGQREPSTAWIAWEPQYQVKPAPTSNAFDATSTPRLPVLMLTHTAGDSAREMVSGGAVTYRLSNFPFNTAKAVVYLDVDTFNAHSRVNKEALALAREAGWPVVIESNEWNSKRVAEVAAMLFPGTNISTLKNTSVIAEPGASGWTVRDTSPSVVAVKAGVPLAETLEYKQAKTFEQEQTAMLGADDNRRKLLKGRAPGSLYARFAQLAYEANPPNVHTTIHHIPHGELASGPILQYQLIYNADVVKVWRAVFGTYGNWAPHAHCVVAWRGSASGGDWLRNIESQFGRSQRVPGEPNTNTARIGHGYASRLKNQIGNVSTQPCNTQAITGHSLGGGMAEAHAYWSRNRELITRVEAYNPARVGNSHFVNGYGNRLGARTGVYCRHEDPVWAVPFGLKHVGYNNGCTYWGARKSLLNPVANHDMSLWLD
jgi:Lipase (class 3)